jgi:exoribonuclease R
VHAFLAGTRETADYPEGGDPSELCAHLNTAARSATMAERQMRKALWLVALARQVAADPKATFPGRVTGIGPKGAFVTLDGSHVSGMVSVRELPGRSWNATADGLALVDDAEHRIGYGDAVVVQIVHADVEAGQLELRLDGPRSSPGRQSGGRKSGGRSGGSAERRPRKKAAAPAP